jgi:hypothetical protein
MEKSDSKNQFDSYYFEQYKLYVDLADRISSRRMTSNSFFVSVHTLLLGTLSVLFKENILESSILGLLPVIGAMFLCVAWWFIVRSYRQLNRGKFKVIHQMEKNLPVAPFDLEWNELGSGKNVKKYLPITYIENIVPISFGILYLVLALSHLNL